MAAPALSCDRLIRAELRPALLAVTRPVLHILRKGDLLPAFAADDCDDILTPRQII